MGPPDEATLITSPDSYARRFGGYTNDSRVPGAVAAYFANGGVRGYVVRVTPDDAVSAEGGIPGQTDDEAYGVGTGSTPITLTHTLLSAPRATTVTVSWSVAGALVSAEGGFAGSGLGPWTKSLVSAPLTNNAITLDWLESAVAKTATLTGTSTVGGTDAANIASATIDRVTGALSVTFAALHTPDASPTATYTPIGATYGVTDLAGVFTATPGGGTVAGTVNYTNGDCSITWTGAGAVPYNGCPITVSYFGRMWGLTASNEGTWGNNVVVRLLGNPNYLIYGTTATPNVGTYTKFDLLVSLLNSSGNYDTVESYEELSFSDITDPMYAPDVINDASDYITMADFGFLDVPANFKGTIHTAEVAGAGTGAQTAFSYTISSINRPVLKGSLVVHYTDGGTSFALTANSSGQLNSASGHLDTTKTNTVNYTTGVVTINFLLANAPDNATNLTIDYVTMPAAYNGTNTTADYVLTSGANGNLANVDRSLVSDAALLKADKKGMYALERIDEMMMLLLPDFAGDVAVQGDMIDYADVRRDLFAILATPSGYSAQEAVDYVRITFPRKSKYAAMYWPWIKIADPLANNRPLLVPPVAHVAGIYARTDTTRNVSKAPGGTVDGALRYLIGLERNPDKGERDTVSPARINTLINTPQTGMAVWGVRSMSSTNDAFKYIASTRLFQFVEKSVFNSTHSLVFENMNTNLYTRIKGQIESFLLGLFNNGYFAGTSPAQAYFVKCDASNNPPEVFNAGQVICDIGMAPNRPGEFIRFRFVEKLIS